MQHYHIGQKIGEFTITSFDKDTKHYTLTCSCGNTTEGASDHVTRKIANLMAEGFTSCMQCSHKMRAELEISKKQNATIYTFKDVYREYVKKAKSREINFELSIEEASELFKSNCYYCGAKPSNLRKRDTGIEVFYQGIDRTDNSLGYVQGNVVPCCKYCNFAKFDRSHDQFLEHVSTIYLKNVQRLDRKIVGSSEPKWETS